MKHHFADFLDRTGDYWTIVPNRERYIYSISNVPAHSKEITIITIERDEEHWQRIFTFSNLEELTLHEPNKEQLAAISELTQLKRLRITHARPKNVEFLRSLINIEELVLEYVSGFSDLSPLQSLKKLRSLHIENVRRVTDFSGLSGLTGLQYLAIQGTLDWKQPIQDFDFVSGLPSLEYLSFWQVINKQPFPALLPIVKLKNLQQLHIASNVFAMSEYALLTVGLPKVKGAVYEPYRRWVYSTIPLPKDDIRHHLSEEVIRENHPNISITYDGKREIDDPDSAWFECVGKGSGRVKCTSKQAEKKCAEYTDLFNRYKQESLKILPASNT